MKVWIHTKFAGHWPVGTSAVVVADTREQAAHLLSVALAERGLDQRINTEDFVRLSTTKPSAHILNDGDY